MKQLWLKGNTPIKIDNLKIYLNIYPNRDDANLLCNGFSDGFYLQYAGPRISVMSKNLVSAEIHKTETLAKLAKEVQLGRILGPFDKKPISTLRISSIGLVEKPDNGWRLITHLSSPNQFSVNDFIDPALCKVKYTSFDKVVNMISELGESARIAKSDISQAFRLLIVNPADFDLLGIKINDKYYIDKCLPMGCSISCSLFEKFATFLQWVVQTKCGLNTLDHYLDDFLFAGSALSNDCSVLMSTFFEVSNEIGVPIAKDKTIGPTTVLTFLGLEINTVLMVVRIPAIKLEKLKLEILNLLKMKKIKLRNFESLIGQMSFCARAIPSARAFLRRFYDLLSVIKIKKPFYKIRITNEVKSDALVWLEFLQNFNGECYILEKYWLSNEALELFTDSSGNESLGCGTYFGGEWIQWKWPENWSGSDIIRDITLLELVPIVLALFTWTLKFEGKRLLFRTDNNALVTIINKRTSKSKRVMKLVRPLVLFTMCNNMQFKAVHVEGSKNVIADALSRFQMARFWKVAPNANKEPAVIPLKILEIISNLR